MKDIRLKRRKQGCQLFIHKSVCSTYYVLGTVLDTGDIVVEKRDKIPMLTELTFKPQVGKNRVINKTNNKENGVVILKVVKCYGEK